VVGITAFLAVEMVAFCAAIGDDNANAVGYFTVLNLLLWFSLFRFIYLLTSLEGISLFVLD
jgi:hypothetical protein